MADRTDIEWCDATWNPMTGCSPISEGCEHCYARALARRFDDKLGYTADGHGSFWPRFHPERLDQPLHWRKPRRIFVCSMSDLFHEAFTDEQRDDVFAIMALASKHTFQVLTKRPGRMHRYMLDAQDRINMARHAYGRHIEATWPRSQLLTAYGRSAAEWESLEWRWPLPNVWLGVTAENQQRLNERASVLLDTPAAVRFVSLEPMLGPTPRLWQYISPASSATRVHLDWVIVGGETGPGARPMDPEWAADVWVQCMKARVPFFFKKWGAATTYNIHDQRFDLMEVAETREFPETSS